MLHSCVPFVPVCQPCTRHMQLSAKYLDVNIMLLASHGHPWKGFLQHAPQLSPIHTRMPACILCWQIAIYQQKMHAGIQVLCKLRRILTVVPKACKALWTFSTDHHTVL